MYVFYAYCVEYVFASRCEFIVSVQVMARSWTEAHLVDAIATMTIENAMVCFRYCLHAAAVFVMHARIP